MKKFIKKLFTMALATLVVALACITLPTLSVAKAGNSDPALDEDGYTIMDNFGYRLDKPFEGSPDSFEAWIQMPNGSLGGTIMGNLLYTSQNFEGTVIWSTDAIGRMKIYWDNGNFVYTFKKGNVNDGQWHHVAVVRDPEAHTFTYYLDGEFQESVVSEQDDLDGGRMRMAVGSDYQTFSTTKAPFEGYIKQITVYTDAISQERVKEDMLNSEITDDYNGQIMGNWYFGERWTERKIADTTANGNDASLITYDKYVEATGLDFEYDYAFVVIPDVQTCVRYHYNTYLNMMQWLVDNKEEQKLEFVVQVGDLSDVGGTEYLYKDAATGLAKLDGKLAYSFVPGNHDYDDNCSATRSQIYYNRHFPYSKHSTLPGFAGAYIEGDMANTYYTYEIGDAKYLVLNLEFGPRKAVLRWAGRVCEMYPQHRVIVNTHAYMNADGNFIQEGNSNSATSYGFAKNTGATSGQEIFDDLVKRHPNVFLAVSGHVPNDDIVVRTDIGVYGRYIFIRTESGVIRLDSKATTEEELLSDQGKMLVYDENTALICGTSKAEYLVFEDKNQFVIW